jgi:endonuclease YncB( thermonuclease family)
LRSKPFTLTASFLLLAAVPALAGVHYRATTTVEDQKNASPMRVEGWVDGEKARVEFEQSANPLMKSGNYLITKDGGKTLYLVNPEDKTYGEWNLDAMLAMVGGMTTGMGPLLKIQFSEPKVEKLAEGDGGTVAGLPTRHYKYRTSYTMKMKVFGMGNAANIVSEQEIWATDKLQDSGLGVWLRDSRPRTGNPEFDRLLAAETGKFSGFPLKTVTVTTTTQAKKGKESVAKSTMLVDLLETVTVPAASFEIPAGYQETQLLPALPAGSR